MSSRTALQINRLDSGVATIEDNSRTTGARFYVHNLGTNADGYGETPDLPFAGINYASQQCTANKNDHIYLMPGHAESISTAAAIALAAAGVTIQGLGNGEDRPILTFTSSTAASIAINAPNVTIRNVIFKVDIDALIILLDVNARDFTIENCEFREGSAKQWLTCIDINGGSANACDRATIRNCKFTSITAGANNAISLGEVADGVLIEDCDIDGDFADAGIHNPTGKVLTNMTLRRNTVRNRQTGDHAIELVSACTGKATSNYLMGDTPGVVFDPGSLLPSDNWEAHKIDSPAVPSPAGLSHPMGWIHVTRATADVFTGSAVPLFSVAGGRVLLMAILGEVTTIIAAGANNFKLQSNPTTGTTSDLCANLDIDADEAGTLYSITGVPADAMLRGESGSVRIPAGPVVLPIGDIEALSAGNVSGSAKFDVWYIPLDSGARMVAV